MVRDLFKGALAGATAGAAGTVALNAVTYLDMVVRARPASSTPQQVVSRLADTAGVEIPGDEETRQNRLSGLGPLAGLVTGVAVGSLVGFLRAAGLRLPGAVTAVLTGATAMAATDTPMAVLGVSDPRRWTATDWLSDAAPHLAYGAVTAAVMGALEH